MSTSMDALRAYELIHWTCFHVCDDLRKRFFRYVIIYGFGFKWNHHVPTNRSNGVGPIPFIFVLNMQLFVSNGSITCLRILTLEIHFFFSFQFFFLVHAYC